MKVYPVTLTGQYVRLEPLSGDHVSNLTTAGRDESIWRYMLYGTVQNEEQMQEWVNDMLSRQARGTDLPFAVISLREGTAIGATRYLEIRPEHKGLEIGGTWYAVEYQRTAANTESKYLLLRHAFETLGCVRVQFKTDSRNEASQRALERLGAVREGTLRNHMITPEGVLRHSVYYSITNQEWEAVKEHLEKKLGMQV